MSCSGGSCCRDISPANHDTQKDYPDLDGDEARRAIWLVDVPLAATHRLRAQINDGKPIGREVLEQYEIPIVASVLKLYLLELPDPIVSSHVYEIIKTIYSTTATDGQESTRIQVIQHTLGTLRLANIATLDAITTHFTRLIELTSADETYMTALCANLATCTLRPRYETTLTMNEKYAYRLLRDLMAHKEEIFGELKRASSQKLREQTPAAMGSGVPTERGRGVSTGERSRREAEQERQAAIASATNRSRATSPAPGSSRMRRERSPHRMSGSADTRFPVAVHGAGSPSERRATTSRNSLEVPGSVAAPAGASAGEALAGEANGTGAGTGTGPRAAAGRPKGVELTDRPMED
jgi:hypothetical protein